jgi:hypothetical protein
MWATRLKNSIIRISLAALAAHASVDGVLSRDKGLAALVREAMGADPFCGAGYVFRAKRADRVKLIFWDGTGMVLVAKRLEDGKFRWPGVQDAILQPGQAFLLEAIDPFAARARANAYGFTGGLRRLPTENHFGQPLSTVRRQAGILMDVHSALPRIS